MVPILLEVSSHSWLLLGVILTMVVLFVTERLPVDVTAMAVVVVLLLGGYVSTEEAFAGFSSPVVVVMVSTLFVAGALRVTGVSDAIARFIQRHAGTNERISIAVIMIISALLSSCMNNVSAATLLMPAVAVLSHEVNIPPSRLFIPLAFSVTIGGMITIIGSPPNILAAELARHRSMEPFSFFEYAPYAFAALITGVLFMVSFGYKLLPVRKTHGVTRRITDLRTLYRLHDRIFSLRVPDDSSLDGKTLGEMRLGNYISGTVVTIIRGGRKLFSPTAEERLHSRDVMLVRGSPERFEQVQALQGIAIEPVSDSLLHSITDNFQIVRCAIQDVHTEDNVMLLRDLVKTTGIVPLAVDRVSREGAWESRPPSWFLDSMVHKGDLIIGCIPERYREESPKLDLDVTELRDVAATLSDSLFTIAVNKGGWAGAPLHRLAHDTKLSILGRITSEQTVEWFDIGGMVEDVDFSFTHLTADHVLREGEHYLVSGSLEDARRKEQLSTLVFEAEASSPEIESADVGITELILTPRSDLIGKTLADLHFREKYGHQVLALWRDGRPMLSLSSGLPLLFGDALLVQGPRKNVSLMAKDPDVLLLSEHRHTPKLSYKSCFAIAALLMLMFVPLLTGMAPHEAAFLSAGIVVFTGAISMEQVYREIDWRVVFLLALMIPLGHAVEHVISSANLLPIVQGMASMVPPILLALLFLMIGSLISQTTDNSIGVIFLGPLALELGRYSDISPTALLTAITLGSSLSFMLPTSCRANLLVTGAGGYKARDFMRVGTPFGIVVALAMLAVLALKDL